ncbi:hypothetical protein POM88_005450 [Heracleum sosnowskyi]|uniref:Uncharacterized protein n=1 Tax=Heracleum sosnowskyi TaxID=360622 RepID=A0AAD8J0S7_9APIA|nr:hypothetical protein POM88_005450 [Heracleum sosnowskyi]
MSFDDFSPANMSISGDEYDHGLEFEFCRVMEPGASPNAPADHLFSNGRLVPHDFPCSPPKTFKCLSRSVSQRSSSFGSNRGFESFSSSWSNSCSSSQRSSSSISSGRTSISDATPERTELIRAVRAKRTPQPFKARKHVSTPDCGSRKWQFIAPAPVLNVNVLHRSRRVSQIKTAEIVGHQKVSKSKKQGKNGRWRNFFCLFVSTCNGFHAIEPSTRE